MLFKTTCDLMVETYFITSMNDRKTIMKKYEYKFVTIKLSLLNTLPKEDYREVIEKEASEGWRFIQLVPKVIQTKDSYELIFEKEKI